MIGLDAAANEVCKRDNGCQLGCTSDAQSNVSAVGVVIKLRRGFCPTRTRVSVPGREAAAWERLEPKFITPEFLSQWHRWNTRLVRSIGLAAEMWRELWRQLGLEMGGRGEFNCTCDSVQGRPSHAISILKSPLLAMYS
jgi:hypothetical protein